MTNRITKMNADLANTMYEVVIDPMDRDIFPKLRRLAKSAIIAQIQYQINQHPELSYNACMDLAEKSLEGYTPLALEDIAENVEMTFNSATKLYF